MLDSYYIFLHTYFTIETLKLPNAATPPKKYTTLQSLPLVSASVSTSLASSSLQA